MPTSGRRRSGRSGTPARSHCRPASTDGNQVRFAGRRPLVGYADEIQMADAWSSEGRRNLWGFIPAILKAKLGAHEVITTMMLSYVAFYVTGYMVNYPYKAPGWVAQTVMIAPSAELPRILQPTQLSASIFIAFILAGLTHYTLQKTAFGYEVRATGLNPTAAENGGINIERGMILAMVISGAMAGLGGSGEVMGVHRRFIEGFSPGYGWDGLAVALVGGLHPVGVLLAAVLFGALRSGGMVMTRVTGVPLDIVFILQALVILFVASPMLIRNLMRRGGFGG